MLWLSSVLIHLVKDKKEKMSFEMFFKFAFRFVPLDNGIMNNNEAAATTKTFFMDTHTLDRTSKREREISLCNNNVSISWVLPYIAQIFLR